MSAKNDGAKIHLRESIMPAEGICRKWWGRQLLGRAPSQACGLDKASSQGIDGSQVSSASKADGESELVPASAILAG